MTSYFRTKKEMISSSLKQFFDLKSVELSHINGMGRDFCHRLYRFIVEGKMLRGAMVSLAQSLYHSSVPREEDDARAAIEAGAAVELIQSALLVHDDIMDRDEMRRTRKSVFYQYVEKAEREGIAEAYHLGESLGICAGDILFFLAFEILAGVWARQIDAGKGGSPGQEPLGVLLANGDLWSETLRLHPQPEAKPRRADLVGKLAHAAEKRRLCLLAPVARLSPPVGPAGAVPAGVDHEDFAPDLLRRRQLRAQPRHIQNLELVEP